MVDRNNPSMSGFNICPTSHDIVRTSAAAAEGNSTLQAMEQQSKFKSTESDMALRQLRPGSVVTCNFAGELVTGTIVIRGHLMLVELPPHDTSFVDWKEVERFEAKYLEPNSLALGIRKDIEQALHEDDECSSWFLFSAPRALWDVLVTYDPAPDKGWPGEDAAFECIKRCLKQRLHMVVLKHELNSQSTRNQESMNGNRNHNRNRNLMQPQFTMQIRNQE